MSNIDKLQLESYHLLKKFLEFMNSKDVHKLENDFEISLPMYEELVEELERHFDKEPYVLSLIPYDEIESSKIKNKNRPIFTIIEVDDEEGDYVVECNIYNHSKLTQIVLKGDLEYKNGTLKFSWPLFKS